MTVESKVYINRDTRTRTPTDNGQTKSSKYIGYSLVSNVNGK